MNVNKTTARIAGIFYLIIIVSGIYAQFFVRQALLVPGDAAATASNILASETLFRLGITADMAMILSDVALGIIFYVLLKAINPGLSLMAAFFRLAQAAVLAVNLLNLFFVAELLSGAAYLAAISTAELQSWALFFLNAHATGYAVGLLFFAMNCLVFGYLVYQSGYFPRILGLLLIFAGFGYAADTLARTLLSDYAVYENLFGIIVFAPAVLGEVAMTLWLLIKGLNVKQAPQAPASTAPATSATV
ncbi:MAG: DUF4386 domain-containing protein [Anaerolineales bacterium]|nr:DUF4386 domain-containing protein [Anaerolineales bacterium]